LFSETVVIVSSSVRHSALRVSIFVAGQWRRLNRARGHFPHFCKLLGTGHREYRGTVSIEKLQTINRPNCTDNHESTHQKRLIVVVEPKK